MTLSSVETPCRMELHCTCRMCMSMSMSNCLERNVTKENRSCDSRFIDGWSAIPLYFTHYACAMYSEICNVIAIEYLCLLFSRLSCRG